jgi:hypothetical protein
MKADDFPRPVLFGDGEDRKRHQCLTCSLLHAFNRGCLCISLSVNCEISLDDGDSEEDEVEIELPTLGRFNETLLEDKKLHFVKQELRTRALRGERGHEDTPSFVPTEVTAVDVS